MKSTVSILLSLSLILLLIEFDGVLGKKPNKNWEGTLSFYDDFLGFELDRRLWHFEDSCLGRGYGDKKNLECFALSDNNVRVANGTLILKAIQESYVQMKLFGKPKNFTSGKVRTTATGFSYGSFVIRARLPKGKHLLPSISLLPAYQDHDYCKYEEVNIVQTRGQKSSTLIFSAHFGQKWNVVASKSIERAFPGTDFSEDFHEFGFVWRPRRLDWYVDGRIVFTATTHFHSDWLLPDESNLPCNTNKSIFTQPLQLNIGLPVGGDMFPEVKYGNFSPAEAKMWAKPTFEIDWVKVYQV